MLCDTHLALLQLGIELLLEIDDIEACGWAGRDLLNPQLPFLYSPGPSTMQAETSKDEHPQ